MELLVNPLRRPAVGPTPPRSRGHTPKNPANVFSIASPRGPLQKRPPLSPHPLQETTANFANAVAFHGELNKVGGKKNVGARKFSRPPTGLQLKNNARSARQLLGGRPAANTFIAKGGGALPNVFAAANTTARGCQKVVTWLNAKTFDVKIKMNATTKQGRTSSNLKGAAERVEKEGSSNRARDSASPVPNRLRNFPVQSNGTGRRLHTEDDQKSIKNEFFAALNRKIISKPKPGAYVSPRCASKKSEEQIKVNTSANLSSNSTISDYQMIKQVGQGAYAIVKEAVHRTNNNKVAIKIYDKLKLLDPQRKKSVNREIQILQKLSHPNIVKLYETIDSIKQLYLVMELIKGRSLYTYLKSKDGRRLPESEAQRIMKQILSAIQYCHKRNVSHRDIKLENILLDEHNEIKIIDFGFSTCYPANTRLRVFCGTPSYMAPEIVTKKDYLGPPADMWAIGVLLFALLSGKFPFKGANDRELYKKIAKGEFVFSSSVSSKARNLIKRLLQVDPSKRPTCEDVMTDPFMLDTSTGETESNALPQVKHSAPICTKYNKEIIAKIIKSGYKEEQVMKDIEQPTSQIFKLYYQFLHQKAFSEK